MVLQQLGNGPMTFAEGIPHGCTPCIDGVVAGSSVGSCHYLDCGDGASFAWQGECWPVPAPPTQYHVDLLHLSSGESAFHVEIEADKGEGEADRFGARIRMLCGPSVDDVLMNERRVATCQRVALQLLVRMSFGKFFSPELRSLALVHEASIVPLK
jgi:hypothetical protein